MKRVKTRAVAMKAGLTLRVVEKPAGGRRRARGRRGRKQGRSPWVSILPI